MKKGFGVSLIIFCLVITLPVFVSASGFSDFWNKITGHVSVAAPNGSESCLNSACDSSNPCCAGLTCSRGVCTKLNTDDSGEEVDIPIPRPEQDTEYFITLKYSDNVKIMCDNSPELLINVPLIRNQTYGYGDDDCKFKDLITNDVYETVFTSEGKGTVNIEGKSYEVTMSGNSASAATDYLVTLKSSSCKLYKFDCNTLGGRCASSGICCSGACESDKCVSSLTQLHYLDNFSFTTSCKGVERPTAISLQLTAIKNQTSGYGDDDCKFKDLITGDLYETVFTSEGKGTVSIGGFSYEVRMSGSATLGANSNNYNVTIGVNKDFLCNLHYKTLSTDQLTCTDSDGGLNYYVKGTVTGYVNSPPELVAHEDCCVEDIALGKCGNEGRNLFERYCQNDYWNSFVNYECPNGCKDGACISPATATSSETKEILEGQNKSINGLNIKVISADKTNLKITATLSVLGYSEQFTLTNDSLSKEISIGGKKYAIELISALDTSATIKVTAPVASFCKSLNQYCSSSECCSGLICSKGVCADITTSPCTCPEGVDCDCAATEIKPKETNFSQDASIIAPTSGGSNNSAKEKSDVQICESGCLLDGKCYNLGYRKSGEFCADSGVFISQAGSGESCENNFECDSNVCAGGKCVSGGLIQTIINWFKKLFGGN